MKRVNMHEAKTHLSRYVAELAPGETLLLCNRNEPVAELRAISKKAAGKPRLGVAQGQFVIPDSFFEPLPDEILNSFYESVIFPPLVNVNRAENAGRLFEIVPRPTSELAGGISNAFCERD